MKLMAVIVDGLRGNFFYIILFWLVFVLKNILFFLPLPRNSPHSFFLHYCVLSSLIYTLSGLRGGAIISFVDSYSQNGDPAIQAFIKHLMTLMCTPFYNMVKHWVFEVCLSLFSVILFCFINIIKRVNLRIHTANFLLPQILQFHLNVCGTPSTLYVKKWSPLLFHLHLPTKYFLYSYLVC